MDKKDFRVISLKILEDTLNTKRWMKHSLEENLQDIDEGHRDIKKVYELVYGVLRNKNYIDHVISLYLQKPNTNSMIQNILRIGYYQIKHMDSIPAYAAINTCVQMAKDLVHPKTSGFVNAVLRNIMRGTVANTEPENKHIVEYWSVKYSYEVWMVKLLLKAYGEKETEAILKASNEKPPVFLRANTLKTDNETLIKELAKEEQAAEEVTLLPGCLLAASAGVAKTEPFKNGLCYIQDLSSQVLGYLVDAGPKDAVIDVGSAPGGKAAYFAQTMKGKGHIVAVESNAGRIKTMEHNLVRLGIQGVEIINHDATNDIAAFHNTADKLVVDAPCSALGVIRRHPEKKWSIAEAEMKEFPHLQYAILHTVKNWVKKGGELYYSTCTINPEENENLIDRFLEKNADFKLADACGDSAKLKPYKYKKFFRSLPGNRHNMDGFFIAKLSRSK